MFYVLAANLEECKKLLAILPMCILYSVCFSYKSGGVNKLWVIQMVYVLCSRYKSGVRLWVKRGAYVLCSSNSLGTASCICGVCVMLWQQVLENLRICELYRWFTCYVPVTSWKEFR